MFESLTSERSNAKITLCFNIARLRRRKHTSPATASTASTATPATEPGRCCEIHSSAAAAVRRQQTTVQRTQRGRRPRHILGADLPSIEEFNGVIDGNAHEFVLAFQPATANQNVRASIEWTEYS